MAISGQKTVAAAGSAEALGNQAVVGALAVKALAANSGLVFIGNDGSGDVSSGSGFQLAAGQQITFEFTGSLSHLWVDAAVSGEGVCWIILRN